MLRQAPPRAALEAFRARHAIPDAEFTVVVGHAATPFDQHVPILRALATLPEAWKRRLTLVLPTAYGGSDAYLADVRAALASAGIAGAVVTAMLNDADVVLLRHASDAFVYLPESDALSGSLQEAAYAGNAVVTGAWLPYHSRLRRAGVKLLDVESFDEVPAALIEALSNRDAWRIGAQGRAAIESICDWTRCADGWEQAYRELV